MTSRANSVLELIGATPAVRLNRVTASEDAVVWAKLESFNPGGNIEDRIGLSTILAAEKEGLLTREKTIVEPTSGNTGVGLAMVAASRGYKLMVTMPETTSAERRKLLKAFGAEVVLTLGREGMTGAVAKAEEMVSENENFFMPQQFKNRANPEDHRHTTAVEILEQIGNNIDAFVAGVDIGETISGVGEILKREIKGIRIVAVEPADSPVLSGGPPGPHRIQRIGPGFVPDVPNRDVIDRVIQVKNEEAAIMARRLAREEGLFVGISSGAAAWAAVTVARQLGQRRTVVVVLPDRGERYLSTDLFEGEVASHETNNVEGTEENDHEARLLGPQCNDTA